MLSATVIIQSIFSGIFLGFLYAVMSFGLALTFGVTRVVNNSHTVSILLGCYISYWLFILLGLDPHISIILSAGILFMIGILLEKWMIEPLLKLSGLEFEMSSLIITFGGFVIVEGLVTAFWSADFRAINLPYSGQSIVLESISLPLTRISSFVLAVLLLIFLNIFLKKTKTGKAIRAVAQDKDAAACLGMNPKYIYMIAFAIGTATAGAAGTVYAITYSFYPAIHREWLGKVFTVVVLGGMGSVTGAFVGGLIIGLLESFAMAIIPASVVPILTYTILILILYIRPTGLFGGW